MAIPAESLFIMYSMYLFDKNTDPNQLLIQHLVVFIELFLRV